MAIDIYIIEKPALMRTKPNEDGVESPVCVTQAYRIQPTQLQILEL